MRNRNLLKRRDPNRCLWLLWILVALAFLFAATHSDAQTPNRASLSLIGDTLSSAYSHNAGRLDVEADATRANDSWSTHARADWRQDWLVGGGETRNGNVLAHVGVTHAVPGGRADFSFTTRAGPRLALETARDIKTIRIALDSVWVPGQTDVRLSGQWRMLEAALWRVGGRDWVPRLALALAW